MDKVSHSNYCQLPDLEDDLEIQGHTILRVMSYLLHMPEQ